MKLRKRLLALALTVVMMAGILVMPAYAADSTDGSWYVYRGYSTIYGVTKKTSYTTVVQATSAYNYAKTTCTSYSSYADSSGDVVYATVNLYHVDTNHDVTTVILKNYYHKTTSTRYTSKTSIAKGDSIKGIYNATGPYSSVYFAIQGTLTLTNSVTS